MGERSSGWARARWWPLAVALALGAWMLAGSPAQANGEFGDAFEAELGRIAAHEAVYAGKYVLGAVVFGVAHGPYPHYAHDHRRHHRHHRRVHHAYFHHRHGHLYRSAYAQRVRHEHHHYHHGEPCGYAGYHGRHDEHALQVAHRYRR